MDGRAAITLVSVNVGAAETLSVGRRRVETGIRKVPVARAYVHELGVAGDVVADKKHHGGRDQAVYLYAADDLAWWQRELGTAVAPGAFGENLTLSSFGPEAVRIGDRFRIGGVVVQATAPRIPCGVFAAHIGEREWVKRFADARRPGFYARVIETGEVAVGDTVEPLGGGGEHPTIVTLMDVAYHPSPPIETLERLLAAPLAERARRDCERKLERVLTAT